MRVYMAEVGEGREDGGRMWAGWREKKKGFNDADGIFLLFF